MTEDDDSGARETEEMRRALGLIGVALTFAIVTGLAVVGIGSRVLEATGPDQTTVLIAAR